MCWRQEHNTWNSACITTVFKGLPSLAYPNCSAVETHSKNCASDVKTKKNFILYQELHQVLNRTKLRIRLKKKKKSTQEIKSYYHQIVVWEKYKCLPRESTVPFLTSHLNEAFLQLWCATNHTPFFRVNNGRT